MSKKYKLPKKFWVKGKSKFLHPRLIEEGIKEGGLNELRRKLADKCEYAGYVYWKDEWRRFIDWIADGKDVDEFFSNLLK